MDFILPAATAVWLGILTSISPCPLATNIAAISFISRKIDRPSYVIWTGMFYTLGRSMTYAVFGWIIVSSLINTPYVSFFLQKYMHKFLGPVLILAGMFLLELISIPIGNTGYSQWIQKRAGTWGLVGAAVMGVVFALSFCPVSAALFFGSLIPLAVQNHSGAVLPILYGAGTSLPVVVFAVFIAFGAHNLSKVYNKVKQVEWWARHVTGITFILVGIYMSLDTIL